MTFYNETYENPLYMSTNQGKDSIGSLLEFTGRRKEHVVCLFSGSWPSTDYLDCSLSGKFCFSVTVLGHMGRTVMRVSSEKYLGPLWTRELGSNFCRRSL